MSVEMPSEWAFRFAMRRLGRNLSIVGALVAAERRGFRRGLESHGRWP